MIKTYKTKHGMLVIREAIKLTKSKQKFIYDWTNGKVRFTEHEDYLEIVWVIKTLEGEMTASEGDYLIKGLRGEFYSCKPDIFEKTYEEIE